MRGFAVGYGFMQILYAEPAKVVELERWGLEHVYTQGLQFGTTYYSHCMDEGRSVFFAHHPLRGPGGHRGARTGHRDLQGLYR